MKSDRKFSKDKNTNQQRKNNYEKQPTNTVTKTTPVSNHAMLKLLRQWDKLSFPTKIAILMGSGLVAAGTFYFVLMQYAETNQDNTCKQPVDPTALIYGTSSWYDNKNQINSNQVKNKKSKKLRVPCKNKNKKTTTHPVSDKPPTTPNQLMVCHGSKESPESYFHAMMSTLKYRYEHHTPNDKAIEFFDHARIVNLNEWALGKIKSSIINGIISNSYTANGEGLKSGLRKDTKESTQKAIENIVLATDYVVEVAAQKRKTGGNITMDELKTLANIILNGKRKPMDFRKTKLMTECSEFTAPEILDNVMEVVLDLINDKDSNLHPVVRNMYVNNVLTLIHPLKDGNGRFAAFVNVLLDLTEGYMPTTDLGNLRKAFSGIMKFPTSTTSESVSKERILTCFASSFDQQDTYSPHRFFTPMPFYQFNAVMGEKKMFKNKEVENKYLYTQQSVFDDIINEKYKAYEVTYSHFKNIQENSDDNSMRNTK